MALFGRIWPLLHFACQAAVRHQIKFFSSHTLLSIPLAFSPLLQVSLHYRFNIRTFWAEIQFKVFYIVIVPFLAKTTSGTAQFYIYAFKQRKAKIHSFSEYVEQSSPNYSSCNQVKKTTRCLSKKLPVLVRGESEQHNPHIEFWLSQNCVFLRFRDSFSELQKVNSQKQDWDIGHLKVRTYKAITCELQTFFSLHIALIFFC